MSKSGNLHGRASKANDASRRRTALQMIAHANKGWLGVGLASLLAFAGGYGWRYAAEFRASQVANSSSSSVTTLSPELKRGEQLSRTYCGACHLYPEPNLLTKRQWIHHIMPQVAMRVGIEPVNYESFPDGKILQQADHFPLAPMMPEEDWLAIWDYYKAVAPTAPTHPPTKPALQTGLSQFRARKINFHEGRPMISLVKIDPARQCLYVGDAYKGLFAALNPAGQVWRKEELGSPPVSLFNHSSGLLVTLIGRFFPSDALEGGVVLVPREMEGSPLLLLDKLRRPTDAVFADLDMDGRQDMAVCSFGNLLGQFAWYRNTGEGNWEEHVLWDVPGATRCQVADLNRDGRPDLIVLMGQARESVLLFSNEGQGRFSVASLCQFPPTHGLVDFQLADFNRDGYLDLLVANGDNGDHPTPHKAYHGIRLFLNDGHHHFTQAWFYPLEGAYKGIPADFDQDGDLDIAAISFYPNYTQKPVENFVYLENLGALQFKPTTPVESSAGCWMVMDAGDLDGDGDIDLALGSFVLGPTTVSPPPEVRDYWKTNGASVLILENVGKLGK